mgnify:FL=1
MKKKMVIITLLFVMISTIILNLGQPIKYIAEGKDPEIEWQTYGGRDWLG